MDLLVTLISAYVATTAAGITLEAPRSLVFKTGIVGVTSYFVYLVLLEFELATGMATFIACFIASLISQKFARIFKAPVTIFYIPTFFLYVPGSAIYQTAFHFINQDMSLALTYLVETLTIAGAIALGVYMSDSLRDLLNTIKHKQKLLKKR